MGPLESFAEIAPYLQNPLVLVGFGLLLVFSLYRRVARADTLAATRLSRYAFTIAVLLIVLGFSAELHRQHQAVRLEELKSAARAGWQAQFTMECLRRNPGAFPQCEQFAEIHGKRIDEAFAVIGRKIADKTRVESALTQAKGGKPQALDALLQEAEDREAAKGPAANRAAAKIARPRGGPALGHAAP